MKSTIFSPLLIAPLFRIRKIFIVILGCLGAFGFLLGLPAWASPATLSLAVNAFQQGDKIENPQAGAIVAEALMSYLGNMPEYELTERRLLNVVFAEHQFAETGHVDPQTVQELGRMTGAEAVATGTLYRPDRKIYVNARIIHVKTGRVLKSGKIDGTSFDDVMGKMGKLAAQLAEAAPAPPPPLDGTVPPQVPPVGCGAAPPPGTVVVALGQPSDALLRMEGRLYDLAEQPFICLQKGSTPFELELARAGRTIYGRFDVLETGEATEGVTFGLQHGGLFKPAHIQAAVEGRPVRYTMGVRSAEGSRIEALRYLLSLRKL